MSDTTGAGATGSNPRIDRIRELNERALEAAQKAGELYVEAYGEALKSMCEQQERLAGTTPIDWTVNMIEAQAEFTREMAKLYAAAAAQASKK
jgi:diphthamide biosynthesis methyltransferase